MILQHFIFSRNNYYCSAWRSITVAQIQWRGMISASFIAIFSKWTAPLLTTLCYAINNLIVMKSRGKEKSLTYKEKKNVGLTDTTHPNLSTNPYWSIPLQLTLFYFGSLVLCSCSCPWWAFLIVALDGSPQLVDLQGLPPQRIRAVHSNVQKLK